MPVLATAFAPPVTPPGVARPAPPSMRDLMLHLVETERRSVALRT